MQENKTGEETLEPAISAPVAEPTPESTQNTRTSPATGASGMVSFANPLAMRADPRGEGAAAGR